MRVEDSQAGIFRRYSTGGLRIVDAQTKALVRTILTTWYGSTNAASRTHGLNMRHVWAWFHRDVSLPVGFVRRLVANADAWSAGKRERVQARYDREMARIREADEGVEVLRGILRQADEFEGSTLIRTHLGYVAAGDRAAGIRQGERARGEARSRLLRQRGAKPD
jgi:hypothetical protein